MAVVVRPTTNAKVAQPHLWYKSVAHTFFFITHTSFLHTVMATRQHAGVPIAKRSMLLRSSRNKLPVVEDPGKVSLKLQFIETKVHVIEMSCL